MNADWKLQWDYDGWKDNNPPCSLYTQQDWNQTFVTKMNHISANINRNSFRGGANRIKIHPKSFKILKSLEYLNITDFGELVISGRYRVVIDKTIEPNKVYVYHENYPMDPIVDELSNLVTIHSDSPYLEEYKNKENILLKIVTPEILVGEITIKNLQYD